jgi:hypothetical protein
MKKIIIVFASVLFVAGCNWGGSETCPNCACDAGCCDSGKCALDGCACACAKE